MSKRLMVLALGPFVLALATSTTATAAGGWMEDPLTGCKIWTDKVMDNQLASWSGDCRDGKASGKGVLSVVRDGKLVVRFDGTMEAGKGTGLGTVTFVLDDVQLRYVGTLAESTLDGYGMLVGPKGGHYIGEFKGDDPHGFGMYVGPEGGRYQGEWQAGKPSGKGYDRTAEGEEYFGEYVAGKREGHGVLTFADGDRYIGDFKEGLPEGSGRWEGVEGDVYEGEARAGKAQGQGRYTSPEGDVYTGPFVDNQLEGEIQVRFADGTEEVQTWKDGKQVED